ncbi:hypothetical protein F2Q68_00018437 [Brassica cretica]|uniref:RRM domain-containing protein n=1 Tax=Brassica cretica TaxID=69181 RepID=A0A8S9HD29_BRACR|nr:hypothetical protein F2Q68_00018437 [Brassica cretica]
MLGKRKKSEDDSEPANLLVKRKLKDDLETKEKHKEEVVVKKKTILVRALPKDAGVADIIDFFKDVGQVALQKIKSLHSPHIFAQIFPYVYIISRYCKDHKVWNKDSILREEDETPPPNFVEIENECVVSSRLWYDLVFQLNESIDIWRLGLREEYM